LSITSVTASKLDGVRCGITLRCGETLSVETMRDMLSCEEKVYPLDEDFFDRIKELTDGVDVDLFDDEDDEDT